MTTESISLRDAIAIDFFLDHITECFDAVEKNEDHVQAVTLLANSSFHIANIFCNTRQQFSQIPTESNDGKQVDV